MQCYCAFSRPATQHLKVLFAPLFTRVVEPYDESRHWPNSQSGPLGIPPTFGPFSAGLLDELLAHPEKYPLVIEWLDSILEGGSQDPTAIPAEDLELITGIADTNPEIDRAVAVEIAYRCTRMVVPKSDCERFAIWSPGFADYPEATQHDVEAIAEGKPFRVNRQYPVHNRGWTYSHETCQAITVATHQCDEYPMAAMVQGGQLNGQLGLVSLKGVPGDQNMGQGRALSSRFYAPHKCGIVPNEAFLVVPTPRLANAPTTGLCNRAGRGLE